MKLVLFIILNLPFLLIANNVEVLKETKAESGLLDLSNYDFDKTGSVAITGECYFYSSEFIDPDINFPQDNSNIVKFPSHWHKLDIGGKKLSPFGYGSYLLRIILPKNRPKQLAVRIPDIGSSYAMYLNGEKIAQLGVPSKDKKTSIPKIRNIATPINSSNDTLNIVIHVSNYHFDWGGIWDPIKLGSIGEFIKNDEKSSQEIFFFSGLFLMIAIFHFVFFFVRRKDYLSLSFAFFTILLCLYILCVGNRYILDLIPQMSFSVLKRIEYVSYFLAVPMFLIFLKQAFPNEINKTVNLVASYIGLAAAIVVLLTPTVFFTSRIVYYHIFTFTCILYSFFVILKSKIHHKEGAALLLFGCGMLFLFAVNTILHSERIIRTGYWLNWGLFFFIISQSILINFRISNSHYLRLKLSRELEDKNLDLIDLTHNLEKKIEERTIELKEAYENIKSLALTDELTGLYNRRSIMELVGFEDNLSKRGSYTFTIGLMDIDNFKSVNDTYGHDVGDEVLKEVAKVAKDIIYQQANIARWGGEEFFILFPDTDIDEAYTLAEIVRKAIEHIKVPLKDNFLSVTVTIGLSTNSESLDVQEIIKKSDEGLYKGKKEGKNQVVKMG